MVVDRNEEAGRGTVGMIGNEGSTAGLFAGDVTSEDDCSSLAAFTVERFGPPAVPINNVGIGAPGTVLSPVR